MTRLDVVSGVRVPLLEDRNRLISRAIFAPNGRWVSFNREAMMFTAPVYADHATPESEWRLLVKGARGERTAGMSPDGGLVYLLLERDGFRCLWAMRVDPETGTPRGEPFVVAHFHDATHAWGSTGPGSAVARGIFVSDLFETKGNLWMTTLH